MGNFETELFNVVDSILQLLGEQPKVVREGGPGHTRSRATRTAAATEADDEHQIPASLAASFTDSRLTVQAAVADF